MEIEQLVPRSSTMSYPYDGRLDHETNRSGVSWAAVAAGAFTAAALWLILLSLGAGLGLSSVSAWSAAGASATALGAGAIVWLVFSQIVSASMGGYLAGRLRTKWVSVHTDEVYFRDTAHGFLAWSVGLVGTVEFLAAASVTMLGTKTENRAVNPTDYYIDQLFRPDSVRTGSGTPLRAEVERIFATGLREKSLYSGDQAYLSQVVADAAGLGQSDADARVSSIFARAQQAAEDARKAAAHSLLWAFVSLLIGAFCASFAATIGGRQRDHVKPVV